MGKKYLDIKKDSLEESILNVWQTAAEAVKTKIDGRTKGYKSHRSKLEARKTKKEEKKELGEARQLKDPKKEMLVVKGGKVVAIDKKDAKEYLNKGWEVAESIEESVLKIWQTAADGTKVEEKKSYEIGTDEYREYLERLTPGETIKEGTKEEYQKFFNAAMKKFKIDSPADLKSDEEKKKFFDYVDKNYKGEKDEELLQLAKEFKISSMKEAIAKVWNFTEKVHVFRVTSKNKQGNVHAKDEKEAVKKAKAKGMKGDIKVTDMGVYKGQPSLEDKENEDKEIKGNKTLTGKKAAVVEVDPKPDLGEKKKKKSGNPHY